MYISIEQIFNLIQQGEEGNGVNPFDTEASTAAIDMFLDKLPARNGDTTIDLMCLIVDERKLAFEIGFKAARSLLLSE